MKQSEAIGKIGEIMQMIHNFDNTRITLKESGVSNHDEFYSDDKGLQGQLL